MKQRLSRIAGTLGLALLINPVVWAVDTIPVLPGSVQPSQVGEALKAQQPSAPPSVMPPIMEKEQAGGTPLSEEAQKIQFQLNNIILVGNTVYSDAELRALFAHDLHKTISIKELFQIIQNITNYYRNNGYILSRAILPPQHVKNGVVKVQIIEGYIGNINVQGEYRGAYCMVQRYGHMVQKCRPLQLSRLERYLLLSNELPGTTVRGVLSPSKQDIGSADLSLVTVNHPLTGYMSYDNYGTRYIGPQQMTGNVSLNSFILSGDQGQTTMTKTAKGGELTYNDVNYTFPVDDNGTRWLFGYTRVHTHPLFVLTPAGIDGVNLNYYTTIYFPAVRTRSESLTYRISFAYMDSDVNTNGERLYADHLRPLRAGFSWNYADLYYGTNMIGSEFSVGLPILGYTTQNNPSTAQTSRPGGRGDFAKVTLQLARIQALFSSWSLYAAFSGQWAFNPLLAGEQFTFGGSQVGRGYDTAELIGDKGMSGSIELRYDVGFAHLLSNVQLYGFYDIGAVYNFLFVGGVPRQQSGTSTGFGARFYFTKYLSGNLMWTQVLTKPVAAEQLIHRGFLPRVFFSLVASFN